MGGARALWEELRALWEEPWALWEEPRALAASLLSIENCSSASET